MSIEELKNNPTREALAAWLSTEDPQQTQDLMSAALAQKTAILGDSVHLRGLIELSNMCNKDCLYCGIRCSNTKVLRYDLNDSQVLEAVDFAVKSRYGSVVIQSGERTSRAFTRKISRLLKAIQAMGDIGITLSCGSQPPEVYQEWFAAGAHRYLLRIESSNPDLYAALHPKDGCHSYNDRLQNLNSLKKIGYQTGTGVMIGFPLQTVEDLADDLLFFKAFDVDMVGMGPYLEHADTPLFALRNQLWPPTKRLTMTLKMTALLRLLLPDINIAAATALQVLDPCGREKAILAGANIIMPNMTLPRFRPNYQIYDRKPGVGDDAELTRSHLEENLRNLCIKIALDARGDSLHWKKAHL